MKFITEPERQLKVIGEYDVVVAGGGFAGISAALAAKRTGAKKVLLLERCFALGGLATLGLVTIYLPLCDGKGNQICYGLAEELFRLSVKHGADGLYPDAWLDAESKKDRGTQRFMVQFNPSMFAVLAEQELLSQGVEILYGTTVCACEVKGSRLTHMVLENKSGRFAVQVRSAVDTTGDADIFKQAGAETALFTQQNILASWYYYFGKGKINLVQLGVSDLPDKDKTEEQKNVNKKRYQAVEAQELSQMVCESHSNVLNHFLQGGGINAERTITSIASIPQVRMTRRIAGIITLDEPQAQTEVFSDCIGKVPNWRRPGPVYSIPLRSLYGMDIKNLITAGRSISVTDSMWDITRVIPTCAVTGEAAGTAAAMTEDFASLNISKLQSALSAAGVRF